MYKSHGPRPSRNVRCTLLLLLSSLSPFAVDLAPLLQASFPVGRIGRAEEVAAACAFLFSADCPMMTGASLTIDGGIGA